MNPRNYTLWYISFEILRFLDFLPSNWENVDKAMVYAFERITSASQAYTPTHRWKLAVKEVWV